MLQEIWGAPASERIHTFSTACRFCRARGGTPEGVARRKPCYDRIIKVGRTIADLADSDTIEVDHEYEHRFAEYEHGKLLRWLASATTTSLKTGIGGLGSAWEL